MHKPHCRYQAAEKTAALWILSIPSLTPGMQPCPKLRDVILRVGFAKAGKGEAVRHHAVDTRERAGDVPFFILGDFPECSKLPEYSLIKSYT